MGRDQNGISPSNTGLASRMIDLFNPLEFSETLLWPTLSPRYDNDSLVKDPVKRQPLSSTTDNVPFQQTQRIRLSYLERPLASSDVSSKPYWDGELWRAAHGENALPLPPRWSDELERKCKTPTRKLRKQELPTRCLLDESIEDLATPTLTPDVSPRSSNFASPTECGLDGEDSQQNGKSTRDFESVDVLSEESGALELKRPVYGRVGVRLRPIQAKPNPARFIMSASKRPDRFITARYDSYTRRESIVISKPVSHMTATERTFRRRLNRSDTFERSSQGGISDLRELAHRLPRQVMRPTRVQEGQSQDTRDDSLSNLRSPDRDPFQNSSRFRNARNATTSREASDSNTHVPVYSSHFLDSVMPKNDQNLHVKRVALACDIDLVNRVLNPSPSMYDVQNSRRSNPFQLIPIQPGSSLWLDGGYGRMTWADNEWIKEGSLRSNIITRSYGCFLLTWVLC